MLLYPISTFLKQTREGQNIISLVSCPLAKSCVCTDKLSHKTLSLDCIVFFVSVLFFSWTCYNTLWWCQNLRVHSLTWHKNWKKHGYIHLFDFWTYWHDFKINSRSSITHTFNFSLPIYQHTHTHQLFL